jgi:hypothetical protein
MKNYKTSSILHRKDFQEMEPGSLLQFDHDSFHVVWNSKSGSLRYNLSNKIIVFLQFLELPKKAYIIYGRDPYQIKALHCGKIQNFYFSNFENTKFLRKIELV